MKGLLFSRRKLIYIILFALLSFVLVYSSGGTEYTASAATTSDGYIFENGSITGYEGTASVITIPTSINGQAVKSIDGAFSYNTTITHVTIPEGITTITNMAFFSCSNLQSITIPASVFTISSGSLGGCENLSAINLNAGNTSFVMVDDILYNAAQTEIVQHINTSPTTAVVIPDTITTVGDFAFANSANIATVSISANTTEIGMGAFAACPNLTSITVNTANPNYVSIGGVLLTKDEKSIIAYPANKSGTSISISSISPNVEVLAPFAFAGCVFVNNITLSANISDVLFAFENALSLTQINVDSANTTFSSIDGVLFSKDGKTLIYYPAGKTASSYTIPSGTLTIALASFSSQPYLETIIIQDGLTTIETLAFLSCENLTKLVVPESVTTFGLMALQGSESLVVWGYPLSKAEYYTDTYGVPFVAIGSSDDWSYTDNGDGTCTLTEYKSADTNVLVPSVIDDLYVDTLGVTAFSGRSDIEYVSFYESITTIDAANNDGSIYLFQDCSKLREIYLPASLEKLTTYSAPYKPFKGATSLVNVIVNEDNSMFYDINGVLFSWDKKLIAYPSGRTAESYSIPNGTTGVSYGAFDNNYLKTVTVPGTVSMLSKGLEPTFKNNITTVYLSEGVDTVGDVFSQTKAMNIYFPNSVVDISGFDYANVLHTFYVYEDSAPHLYAVEKNIKFVLLYVIKFNSNGGTSAADQIVPNGSKISEPSNVTKANNVLIGWYTDVALTNKWSFKDDTASGSMTLNAKWVEGYPIIYNMNGGTNDPDNPPYYVKGTVVELDDPTKTGYTFDGWYTDPSCELKYKFEAIEKDSTGTVELWADWWIIPPTSSTGTSTSSTTLDIKKPEVLQDGLPEYISYMQVGQNIKVEGKLYIQYADVDEIAVQYPGHTDKLYKYEEGSKRLTEFKYSHAFTVDNINYNLDEKYVITLRLATGDVYQHYININKYHMYTEALHAPDNILYMSSDKKYELRSMATANNFFETLSASYVTLTPEICEISADGSIKLLASGEAKIKTIVTLADGENLEYENIFNVVEKTSSEPTQLEKELMCPCYGQFCSGLPAQGIDPELLRLIEKIREEAGVPVYIITGYRCEDYNRNINADGESEHVLGRAADLWSPDLTAEQLYTICDSLNLGGGVGQYPSHVHIDTRGAYIRWIDE
ncbi:MAG: leucine-rich repeat protein [Clostridia bacterium]|nr:leucine-rich repeat protein [Clostridia bacterium]